jgi:type IV secretory pathway VirJ component
MDLDTKLQTTVLNKNSAESQAVGGRLLTPMSPSKSIMTSVVGDPPSSEANNHDLLQCLTALDSDDRSCDAALTDLRSALVHAQEAQEGSSFVLSPDFVATLEGPLDAVQNLHKPEAVLTPALQALEEKVTTDLFSSITKVSAYTTELCQPAPQAPDQSKGVMRQPKRLLTLDTVMNQPKTNGAVKGRVLAPVAVRSIPTNMLDAEQALHEFDTAKSIWGPNLSTTRFERWVRRM